MPVHPSYIVKNPSEPDGIASSVPVLRASDNSLFLASKIPTIFAQDVKKTTYSTKLAPAILPTAAVPISRILNHPNIISLVDITHTSALPGSVTEAGEHGDMTIWEDMDAGSLAYLLPSPDLLPAYEDEAAWHALASQNFQRFSLPESLCWHVLRSISRSLLWLHHGVKETQGIPGDWQKHDNDWQPILIMDVSPGQIWFQQPKGEEVYGLCKLGGFQYARVTGNAGGQFASAPRLEGIPSTKQYYWALEVYKGVESPSRASEIWSLGAVVYTMMTGMPPPRRYEYHWQISRMNDKGFSEGIRDIVSGMLNLHPLDRPTALQLVDDIDGGWRAWRANTEEGMAFVDVGDARLAGISGRVV